MTVDAGSTVQKFYFIISANSSLTNSLCSNADLCGPRLIASPFCFVVPGEVVRCTDAAVVYRLCRTVAAGCGSCCRLGFKSPFDRNFER
jgi:hypothetical protein